MPVAIVGSPVNNGANFASSPSQSITVPATTDCLAVALGNDKNATSAPSTSGTLSYGGVLLTKVRQDGGTSIWRLLAPTVGTASLAFFDVSQNDWSWTVYFLSGVNQTAPTPNTAGAARSFVTNTSDSITCPAGGMVIDSLTLADGFTATAGGGQTPVPSGTGGHSYGTNCQVFSSSKADATSMAWTHVESGVGCHTVVAFAPAADTTPPTLTSPTATGGTLTGTGGITSNEAGTSYFLVNNSATPLTIPVAPAAMTGWTSRAMTAGAQTFSLGALAAGSGNHLHQAAEDPTGNRTTTDVVAGPFTVASGTTLISPTVVSAGSTIATVRVTTNTAPTGSAILAVQVLPAATADPSSAAILASPTQTITSGASGARDFSLTGLTNGTAVKAHFTQTGGNVVSTASFTPSTVPGAPTIGTTAAGNAQATVNGTIPASNGGSAITGYRSTATPGGSTVTGASLPITHTGITNGTGYTFTLAAGNANGYGAESAASNSVTPSAGTLYGFRFASTAGLEFGNIVGALTGLGLRPAAEQWVATAHDVANHATIIAQSPPLVMGSGGRLANWSNASIANATNYFVSFRRVSDNWTCSAVLTAELVP